MRLLIGCIIGLLLLIVFAYNADRNYCNGMLASSRTNTDTLIVLTSRRCVFIAKDVR